MKERVLIADILKAFNTHGLDILCLNELGELGVGLGARVPQGNVVAWISELLKDSAVPPVDIFCDSHYATLANKLYQHRPQTGGKHCRRSSMREHIE